MRLYPTIGPDRNANAKGDMAWKHGNYTTFQHNFSERLHKIQHEYAEFHIETQSFDEQIKDMDGSAERPEEFQFMWDTEFCSWVNELVELADQIPHSPGGPSLGKCYLDELRPKSEPHT